MRENSMTQNERLLNHLLTGKTITPLEALGVFGIYRLAARVYELKAKGHDIECTTKLDPNGNQYGSYKLVTRRRDGTRKRAA